MPSIESRYSSTDVYEAFTGNTLRDDYIPFRYEAFDDNIVHVAAEGDTWWTIAQRYYFHISSNAGRLWWVVCDFQPQPVVDPTIAISPNRTVIIPSPLVVLTQVLGVRREVFL